MRDRGLREKEGESGCSYQGYQGRNGDDREDRLEYYIPSLEPALECGISGAQNERLRDTHDGRKEVVRSVTHPLLVRRRNDPWAPTHTNI